MGLNKDLNEVWGRVLGIKPLPGLREAFCEVRRKESRRRVMMGDAHFTCLAEESSALTTRTQDARMKKGRPWCHHCRKLSHTREKCWKIHGKPSDKKFFKSETPSILQTNHASAEEMPPTVAESNPFSP